MVRPEQPELLRGPDEACDQQVAGVGHHVHQPLWPEKIVMLSWHQASSPDRNNVMWPSRLTSSYSRSFISCNIYTFEPHLRGYGLRPQPDVFGAFNVFSILFKLFSKPRPSVIGTLKQLLILRDIGKHFYLISPTWGSVKNLICQACLGRLSVLTPECSEWDHFVMLVYYQLCKYL